MESKVMSVKSLSLFGEAMAIHQSVYLFVCYIIIYIISKVHHID